MGMDDYLMGGSLSLDPLLRLLQMKRRREGAKWRREGARESILWGIDYNYGVGYNAEDKKILSENMASERWRESKEGKLMKIMCDYLKTNEEKKK